MNTSEVIATLNSTAATLLQEGNQLQARNMLVQAMQQVQSLSNESSGPKACMQNVSCNAMSFKSKTVADNDSVSSPGKVYSVSLQHADEVVEFGAYNGFFLLSNSGRLTFSGEQEITAVLLYNLALIYHRASTKKNQLAGIKKALQLYQSSLDLLQGLTNAAPSLTVMEAALYHNMAHINVTVLFDFDKSNELATKLENLVEPWSTNPHVREEDYLFFLQSLLVAGKKGSRPAPAA